MAKVHTPKTLLLGAPGPYVIFFLPSSVSLLRALSGAQCMIITSSNGTRYGEGEEMNRGSLGIKRMVKLEPQI